MMKSKSEFIQLVSKFDQVMVYKNYHFKDNNTFQINYLIETLIVPYDVYSLKKIILYAIEYELEYVIIGNGSKILFSSNYVKKIVILLKDNFNRISFDGRNVYAASGASLAKVIHYAYQYELGGMERLVGIPASIGGAIYKNAGAHQSDISQFILKVDYIDSFGQFKTLTKEECQFNYRSSIFQKKKKWVIIGAMFDLPKVHVEEKKEEMKSYLLYRNQHQPINKKNSGSIFKNPPNQYAAQLIESCNLKGYKINDAMISNQHANFIINEKNATPKDIMELISLIQQKVYEKYQIQLELELEIIY